MSAGSDIHITDAGDRVLIDDGKHGTMVVKGPTLTKVIKRLTDLNAEWERGVQSTTGAQGGHVRRSTT